MNFGKALFTPLACLVISASLNISPSLRPRDQMRETIIYSGLRPTDSDIYLFESPGKPPRKLAADPALDYNAVFSPDGRWVVFCSERRGNPDLYAVDLNKSEPPIPLTESRAMEDAPSFSPDGKHLVFVSTRDGNADIFLMNFQPGDISASVKAANLSKHPMGDFNPAFSPDGKKIVFSSNRNGYRASEIYAMNIDGSDQTRLTDESGWDGSPAWSAAGKQIYFYSDRQGGFRIWRMNADGSNPQPIASAGTGAFSPAISKDGRIAFASSRSGKSSIWSILKDGSKERLESDALHEYWAPSYDPIAGRMVCHGASGSESFLIAHEGSVQLPDRSLWISAIRGYFPSFSSQWNKVASAEDFNRVVASDIDGKRRKEISSRRFGSAWSPSWSRDGRWIAFSVGPTFASVSASVDIWKIRPDGGEAMNLTSGSQSNDAFPDFSPDARRIVFRSGRDGNFEIYLMDSDGKNPRRLTNSEATDTMPAFSPLGDMVAFTSNRDDDFEIYTLKINPDGRAAELRRVTRSPGLDMHPKFSPDGKWLVFASERGGINDEEPLIPVYNPQPYGEIWAVRLEDGMTERLTHNKWEDGTPTWASMP